MKVNGKAITEIKSSKPATKTEESTVDAEKLSVIKDILNKLEPKGKSEKLENLEKLERKLEKTKKKNEEKEAKLREKRMEHSIYTAIQEDLKVKKISKTSAEAPKIKISKTKEACDFIENYYDPNVEEYDNIIEEIKELLDKQ